MSPIRTTLDFVNRRPVRVFMLLVLLVGLTLFALELRRIGALYWYDVAADHSYEFSARERVRVRIDGDGFLLPAQSTTERTLVLALRIESTLLGRWFEPSLVLRAPGHPPSIHTLERGARGRRYVVIDPAFGDTVPTRIDLQGDHLRWSVQDAELLLFDAPPTHAGPLLVLATHPDDAEIAAFGLYAAHDAWVVTVSPGQNVDARMAELVEDPMERARLKGELRAWDSVAVPLWGDVPAERSMNLGYFNQSLARLYADPNAVVPDPVTGDTELAPYRRIATAGPMAERDAVSSWQSLVDDLVVLLEQVQPAVIVTPHPALDASSDHRLTTVALLEALGRLGGGERTLLTYTNHASGSEYYPFGNAEAVVTLPPWTGTPLPVGGVFSQPLDARMRVRKLYALEAHHDLRAAPRYVEASPWRQIVGESVQRFGALLRDPTDTFSYLRRAPRPNEVFLVFDEADAGLLLHEVEDWLLGLRSGSDSSAGY